MGRTVEELLVSISSEELTEWAAYYKLDPFGSVRGDMQAAMMASTMANIHATPGHSFTLADFMLKFGKRQPAKRMSPQEIHARLSTMMKRSPHG